VPTAIVTPVIDISDWEAFLGNFRKR